MRLSLSGNAVFNVHLFFLHFFISDLQHNSKKHAIYWLGGLWRELSVGRGEENKRAGSRRNMQLLDDIQMHFAHTEHTEEILCTATQRKTTISEPDKNLKH